MSMTAQQIRDAAKNTAGAFNADGTVNAEALTVAISATPEEITAAFAAPAGDGGTKAKSGKAAKAAAPADVTALESAADATDKPDSTIDPAQSQVSTATTQPAWVASTSNTTPPPADIDIAEQRSQIAAAAKEEKAGIDKELGELARARAALDEKIDSHNKRSDSLSLTITENTRELTQAQMVKKIQKQTQDRLLEAAKANEVVAGHMKTAGIRVMPSALDATLQSGGKRSQVLVNGKVFVAPHPRSAEGIRNYASWIHNGQKQPT